MTAWNAFNDPVPPVGTPCEYLGPDGQTVHEGTIAGHQVMDTRSLAMPSQWRVVVKHLGSRFTPVLVAISGDFAARRELGRAVLRLWPMEKEGGK